MIRNRRALRPARLAALACAALVSAPALASADAFWRCVNKKDPDNIYIVNKAEKKAELSRSGFRCKVESVFGSDTGGSDPSRPARTTVVSPRRDAGGRVGPRPSPGVSSEPSARAAGPVQTGAPRSSGSAKIHAGGLPTTWDDDIEEAARFYRLPPAFLRAVIQVESGFNPGAVSHKGAIGLMQLMPETAKGLGVADPSEPRANIFGGALFLRKLANKFGGDLVKVLSAYHAGSLRVLESGATPFAATDDYVRKVLRTYYAIRDAGHS